MANTRGGSGSAETKNTDYVDVPADPGCHRLLQGVHRITLL